MSRIDEETRDTCADEEDKKLVVSSEFLRKRDVNGDQVADYILDFGWIKCGDNGPPFCGTGGCWLMVAASFPNGRYEVVYHDLVRDVKFRTVSGRPAMLLNLHGSACGKVGVETCRKTALWNGKRFVVPENASKTRTR